MMWSKNETMHIVDTYHLVGNISMILSGQFLPNGALHKSRKGGEDIDRRVDLAIVQVSVDNNLPLCDVTCQIWDRMGNV
jgi:hypothetical protein